MTEIIVYAVQPMCYCAVMKHLLSLHKNTIETMKRSLWNLREELKDITVCEKASLRRIRSLEKSGLDPLDLKLEKKNLRKLERDWENTNSAILYLDGAIQQVRNGREYLGLAVNHISRVD